MTTAFHQTASTTLLDEVAGIAILVSAVVSLVLTVYAGRRNPSSLLMALFAIWVVSPFVGFVAAIAWQRWKRRGRRALLWSILFLGPLSVAVYGRAVFGTAKGGLAFWFLVAPAVSWSVLAVVLAVDRWRTGSARALDAPPTTNRSTTTR
jgi:hypothetical protein